MRVVNPPSTVICTATVRESADGQKRVAGRRPGIAYGGRRRQTATRSVPRQPRGLAGHAAFETFSVLTRLPAPARRTPATVARLLAKSFPHSRFLGAEASASLLGRLDSLGIAGGSAYGALVAAAAVAHNLRLASRDRRALETYRALGIEVEFLS